MQENPSGVPKGKRREALQGGLISQAYINGSLLEHEWVIIYDLKWGIVEQYNGHLVHCGGVTEERIWDGKHIPSGVVKWVVMTRL